ncbi:facilitated trehalose transporter Tret1 [Phlebotomus argentipes]|uniref:facilitated trehalose transporter Tret1 n=1 Tax=Phlebotomus argentipes TaxID=94469 RepID=UPI002893639B|nr:facilitated trehalose transporter Tret1 [Phlebotomus argentipes]
MNPAELNYQPVSAFESSDRDFLKSQRFRMEQGKSYRQFLAGVVVNIASLALGTTLGWTSPVFPKISSATQDDTPLDGPPDDEQLSWIGSLVALGALIAPFIAGPLADKIGRKWTLLSSTAFFAVSWILLITTNNVPQMYVARFLQGFGVGFVMTVQTMYIGEIASDQFRGALGSLMQLFIVAGILYVYAIGPYVTYVSLQWICLIPPLGFAAAFFFMPETPYYYTQKGDKTNAIKSLQFLRGKTAEGVQEEALKIQEAVDEAMKNKGTIKDLVRNKGNFKALIICAGLISFQQLSGINVVLFYSQIIFAKTGSSLEPAIATIIVGIVQVVASGLTPFVVDRLGRKIILLFSGLGMAICHALLGLYFFLDYKKAEVVPDIGWLPVLSVIGFVSVYCVGFGPLPWAVLGEMFPANVKSIASSMVASTCWILGFLVTKYFSALDSAVGSHWAFWIFGLFCCGAFVFTFTTVMETKGQSLQEIQDRLNGRRPEEQ